MSKILLIISLITLTICRFSQQKEYFNGMVKHKHSYKSETLNADSLSSKKSVGDIYYFHENLYQGITFVGENQLIYTYDSERNSCLDYNLKASSISCNDYSINQGDTLVKSYKKEGAFTFNGMECELYILDYPTVTYHYYVTDGFYIDPKLYENHHAYDYSTKMKVLGGRLAIRTEIIKSDYTMVIDLIDYEESKEPLTDFTSFDNWWKICSSSVETAK